MTVPEGHYTVLLDSGGHRTLEVSAAGAGFRAGPLIVSFLFGPDNEHDYRPFAHIATDGSAHLWRRFHTDGALAEALAALVADPARAETDHRRQAMRCTRCRRPLTHPDSLERGMGARCARQLLASIPDVADDVVRSP